MSIGVSHDLPTYFMEYFAARLDGFESGSKVFHEVGWQVVAHANWHGHLLSGRPHVGQPVGFEDQRTLEDTGSQLSIGGVCAENEEVKMMQLSGATLGCDELTG